MVSSNLFVTVAIPTIRSSISNLEAVEIPDRNTFPEKVENPIKDEIPLTTKLLRFNCSLTVRLSTTKLSV